MGASPMAAPSAPRLGRRLDQGPNGQLVGSRFLNTSPFRPFVHVPTYAITRDGNVVSLPSFLYSTEIAVTSHRHTDRATGPLHRWECCSAAVLSFRSPNFEEGELYYCAHAVIVICCGCTNVLVWITRICSLVVKGELRGEQIGA